MSTPTVPRLPATAPAEQVADALHTHGVVIIERLLDDEACDQLSAELAPWIETTPYGADPFSGVHTRRTGGLLTRCPTSAAMVAHPLVLDVVDRVGGGDGYAAGFIYGLLSGASEQEAVNLGWSHGALLTTFPGDTTMATVEQVKAFAKGGSARIQR